MEKKRRRKKYIDTMEVFYTRTEWGSTEEPWRLFIGAGIEEALPLVRRVWRGPGSLPEFERWLDNMIETMPPPIDMNFRWNMWVASMLVCLEEYPGWIPATQAKRFKLAIMPREEFEATPRTEIDRRIGLASEDEPGPPLYYSPHVGNA